MNQPIGVFTLDDAAAIRSKVLGKTTSEKTATGKLTVSNRAYYVRLTTDLSAATNPLTGYSQATATVIRYLSGTVDTLDMEETNEVITVTNRSSSYSASENSVIQVDRLGSEWAPKHASGGSNSQEDECPCFCVDQGNLTVNGIDVLIQYTVSLPELVWKNEYGSIILPAGNYIITWVPSRQLWVLDIGDLLTAVFDDGSDATEATTMDGEITMSFPSVTPGASDCCIDAELKVCVDGTVPQPEANAGVVAGFTAGYGNGYAAGYAGDSYDATVVFESPPGTGAAYEDAFYASYPKGYESGYANGDTEFSISPGAGVGGP